MPIRYEGGRDGGMRFLSATHKWMWVITVSGEFNQVNGQSAHTWIHVRLLGMIEQFVFSDSYIRLEVKKPLWSNAWLMRLMRWMNKLSCCQVEVFGCAQIWRVVRKKPLHWLFQRYYVGERCLRVGQVSVETMLWNFNWVYLTGYLIRIASV